MTRETKVGLIVGLAFIVVFAVILSHKGGQPRAADTSDLGPIVDASPVRPATSGASNRNGLRQTGNTATARTAGRVTSETATVTLSPRPQPAMPESMTEHARSLSGTASSATPSSAANAAAKPRVPLAEMPNNKSQGDRGNETLSPALRNWLDDVPKKAGEGTDRADSAAKPSRVAPPTTPLAPPPASVDVKPPMPSPPSVTPTPSSPTANDSSSEPKPRIKQEYIAKKGETVTKIAQKVYGKNTPREIDAILAANKKEVPEATKLRAGAKLVIPELPPEQFEVATFPPSKGHSQPPTEIALTSSSNPPGKSLTAEAKAGDKETKDDDTKETKDSKNGTATAEKSDKESNWRWYTMQEGDTFAAIARKHLGSADRWKEIADLNKTKFRDPLRVPAGAKIKLPSNVSGLSKL